MGLISYIQNLWQQYKENKKRQALYDRLDRNAAGKFNMKQYKKDIKSAVKMKKDGK
jgi:hypothetical protein